MTSLSITQMREALSKAYESRKWKTKVSRMPEHQVQAIYYRFKQQEKV